MRSVTYAEVAVWVGATVRSQRRVTEFLVRDHVAGRTGVTPVSRKMAQVYQAMAEHFLTTARAQIRGKSPESRASWPWWR